MDELRNAIAAERLAAVRLTEACEAYLGRAPASAVAKVIHVAFRDLTVTPPDMAVQLGRMR